MAVRSHSHYPVPCDAAPGCLVYVSKGRVWLETPRRRRATRRYGNDIDA